LTVEAGRLLGNRIRLARKERGWTVEQLAERVGVAHVTISKVERGNLTVALGTAFEAAAVVGVPLFDPDPRRRSLEADRVMDRLALLPRLVRPTVAVDDDF
jgi:transcriptional regulator with XRE-family HTH domain